MKLNFITKMFFMVLFMMNLLMLMNLNKFFLMYMILVEFFVTLNLSLLFYMNVQVNEWMIVYYLIYSVCDAVMGFAVLVSMLETIGNEGFMKINLSF